MSEKIDYKDAGVDIDEGARAVDAIRSTVSSTHRPEVIGDIGSFGGLFSAAGFKDMEDPVLVSGADGVGTKLQLAQTLDRHDTIGIDLVAMCANDIVTCGAEPLFLLDYIAAGKLKSKQMKQIVDGVAEGCCRAGCALIGGEMAEHPGVMDEDDYDISGFCVGVVDRPQMIDPQRVAVGDVVLGLASSGMHSNGFSLVRRAVTDGLSKRELRRKRKELGGVSLADALLAPTRIYVRSILEARKVGLDLHAVAHITGGGITENLNRALPDTCDARISLGSWDVPPIIDYVVKAAGLDVHEALETFNMGIGMCVVCAQSDAEALKTQLTSDGETVYTIGSIVDGDGKVVYAHD